MRPVADERTAVAAALASMLAAATLCPLVAGLTWLVVAGVVVITLMVTGIIARHLLNHWAGVATVQLLVLLLALEVLFARSRLLEGPGAVTALTDLLRAGLQVTREQPPPVDASQGVMLLAVGGTGIVALLVDVLAASLRQPALSGLPLLAVYCVPAALLPDGLPWYYFAAAAAGFLLLLSADAGERTQAWGRILSSDKRRTLTGPGSALSGLGTGGRRVGAAAVAAAVLLPAIMPGLGDQIIGGNGLGDGTGNGRGGSITRINPILDLRKNLTASQDTPIISYTTEVKDPQPLRIVTADVFDGEKWAPNTSRVSTANHVQDGLSPPPGLGGAITQTPRTSQFRITGLKQTYLPLPYPATKVQIDGDWLYDPATLNVIGNRIDTRDTSYTADYLDVEPTAEQLAGAGSPSVNLSPLYLSLPDRLATAIAATAREVAKTGSQYQQAVRLQRWFTESGGFTYSTGAPTSRTGDSSTDAISQFLQVKRGYCVHFASAMAVMARTLHIPARVAIGFLPGERQANGRWVISVHDAHAWPELYFEGVGWVRFEPTPRTGLAEPPAWTIPPSGTLPEDPLPSVSQQPAPSSRASTVPTAKAAPQEQAAAARGAKRGSGVPLRLALVVLVVVAVLMVPWLTGRLASSRRWRTASSPGARAEAAWVELRLGLQDRGVSWAWTWTPRAVQRRLGDEYDLGDTGTAALARLAAAIETARYAPPIQAGLQAGAPADGLRGDVQSVLVPVDATLSRSQRLRARWAPPSAGAVLGSLLSSPPWARRPADDGGPGGRGRDGAGPDGRPADMPEPDRSHV